MARYILVWAVTSLFSASPAVSKPSESADPGRACPLSLALARTGRNRAGLSQASLSPSVHVRPALSLRPGPALAESQDSVGIRATGLRVESDGAGWCAGCTYRNRCDAEAVRPGAARLADQSITEGGCVGAILKQQR